MAFDVEQLFESIDIILGQRLQDVNFDKTIICTIVDDSDKKNGCYVVSDGTIKFNAYVSDSTYNKDDQVRVSILGGDFNEKKFITGRYTGDEQSKPITYKSPLDSIIPITGNLVQQTVHSRNGVNGLAANGNIIQQEIWRVDLSSDNEFRDLQANGIYNTLTIKADFKTLLSKYDLTQGNYGLCLQLFIQPSFDNPHLISKYINFDSSEMMGNPYSFSVYSTQAKVIDIMSTGVIAEMVLWLYQSNNFSNGKKSLEAARDSKGNLIDNILVKNIEIGFGSDIVKVEDNTLEIFTSSPPYYVYQNPSNDTNVKEMELLWFNKTENNEYIGFSDGLYDLDYDEIQYLKLVDKDTRLTAQKGRTDIPNDEPGLKLAADLKDAKPLMIKARDALTREVAEVLYKLQRQTKSSTAITTELNKLLDTTNGNLVTQWNAADTALNKLNEVYVGILQYAYDKQNEVENPTVWNSEWKKTKDYHKDYINAIKLGIEKVNAFFVWLDGMTQPQAAQSAHRGNYDLYVYRMNQQIENIENYLDQLETIFDIYYDKDNNMQCRNQNKLYAYKKVNYQFIEYAAQDLTQYDNKYCIYWYRYDRSYKLEYQKDSNNDEYNYGKFVTNGWKRLELTDNSGAPLLNLGLPRVENNEKPGYYPAKSLLQVLIREMDINFTEEKYMAILFHNHEMYKSNVITFTNSEPELIPNSALLDKKDALKIEHDVASMEHYQLYNEFNLLRSLEDGGKVRQLKCLYDGVFKKDEALINAGLYWYVPNHSTMLTFDKQALIDEGFNTDADNPTDKSIAGYTYFYKKVGKCAEEDRLEDESGSKYDTCLNADRYFFYKIKPQLEKDAQNNTILVKAYIEGMDDPVEGEITMTFSAFGTNGTKYTLAVVPATSQVAVIGKDKPLMLNVGLRDSQNNPINISDGEKIGETDAFGFSVESWNNLPNAFVTTPIYDETKSYIKGLTVNLASNITNWNNETPYFGILNAKVSFGIEQEENPDNQQVEKYQKQRVVDLNTLYAIPYSASDAYYMSGATHIVYNNQGNVSYVSEDEYKLYRVNQKDSVPVADQNWHIMYYDRNGNWINESSNDWAMLLNYMPVLNSERRLTPAPLYINGLDYIPVVVCTVKDATTGMHDIAWVQPIIITQNRYASPTMNDWNGSFTINEKNGTILSTAIGAGKKEYDNSFSGVLMGDIEAGLEFDPDNTSGLGLYGFNFGEQSFCLSTDGTAFFGKAGRGRIIFDGENGTIASASFQQNRNVDAEGNYLTKSAAAGMIIDLDDGYLHMKGTAYNAETGKYEPDLKTIEDKKTAQAEILLTVGENDDYEITDSEGNKVTVDNTAYLKIRSAKQYNPDHYLLYVGSEQYYLQTDNYKPWEFTYGEDQGELDFSGGGLKLDLQDGKLDAYNFKLSSKNVFINSTDESSAFFVIKDNAGSNLFYAGPNDYYLKSNDYKSGERGVKFTLQGSNSVKSGIEAYNFDLRAGKAGNGYEIILSDSGNPYLQINTEVNNEKKTLINFSRKVNNDNSVTENYYLQSSDYNSTNKTGMRIDLKNKKFYAYEGFKLQVSQPADSNGKTRSVILDVTSLSQKPLKIGDNFEVDWNGTVTANDGVFKGTVNASSGSFNGEIYSTKGNIGGWKITADGLENSTASVQILSAGSLKLGDNFSVTNKGHLTCTSANIGGWDVKEGSSGFTNGTMTFDPTSGVSSSYWNTDKNGKTTIKHLEIEEKLTAVNNASFTISGAKNFYITDAEWIYLSADYIKITGAIGIGGNPYKDAGGIRVAGDVCYIGDIYCGDPSDNTRGITEDYTVKTGWFKSSTLHFTKGILTKVDSGDTDSTNLTFPEVSSTTAGKFLSNDGSSLLWKSIGVTVANKSNTTVEETNTADVYKITIPYRENYNENVTVNTTQWVGFDVGSSTGGQITLYECSEYAAKNYYKYCGVVYSSGTGNASGTVEGNVSGKITAKVTSS